MGHICAIVYIWATKRKVNDMGSKMGRPTDNRKGKSIHVRLDEQSDTILEIYTKQENISRAEAIRRGIYKLESDINK